MNELRERIARAIHEDDLARFPESFEWGSSATNREAYYSSADAVIAALGLREVHDGEGHYWQTPWERIEEDG